MTKVQAFSRMAWVLRLPQGLCLAALLAFVPVFSGCASAASDDTFILPPPADHDGPNVKAQPVPPVDVRPLDSGAAMPRRGDGVEPVGAAKTATPPADTADMAVPGNPESALWRRVLASDDPELTKIYLLSYPAGRHVAEARVRFRDLLFALGERRRLEWRESRTTAPLRSL